MNKSEKIKLRRGPWGDLCFIAGCGLLIWALSLPVIYVIILAAYGLYRFIPRLRL